MGFLFFFSFVWDFERTCNWTWSFLRRIWVSVPARSSSQLWLMPTETSINLAPNVQATHLPSTKQNGVIVVDTDSVRSRHLIDDANECNDLSVVANCNTHPGRKRRVSGPNQFCWPPGWWVDGAAGPCPAVAIVSAWPAWRTPCQCRSRPPERHPPAPVHPTRHTKQQKQTRANWNTELNKFTTFWASGLRDWRKYLMPCFIATQWRRN